MFRFLFRLAAMVALSVAVIMAVLDATRTVAASALVHDAAQFELAGGFARHARGLRDLRARQGQSDDMGRRHRLGARPAGLCGVRGACLLLYAIGYRRQRRGGEFAPG